MTERTTPVHIYTPIEECEEIPYDPADIQPGPFLMEIEFNRDELERLKTRSSRDSEPLGRFIKRAALETADREAKRSTAEDLREAD